MHVLRKHVRRDSASAHQYTYAHSIEMALRMPLNVWENGMMYENLMESMC